MNEENILDDSNSLAPQSTYRRFVNHGYFKYFRKKIFWFLFTLVSAVILNFLLPRLMPGDPISTVLARLGAGVEAEAVRRYMEHFQQQFGIDKPLYQQFFIYVGNIFRGDLGVAFSQYPRPVTEIIGASLPYTLILLIPAILTGWIIGNVLGAIAAYIRKGFDKVLMPTMLFIGGIPAFGMAIILLSVFAIALRWLPAGGGYPITSIPPQLPPFWFFSIEYIRQVFNFLPGFLQHYHLPFWSIVLLAIGGQSIGMRSMSIYELNADYVKYSRYMGIKDYKIVGYVFRNAMLPQITGLALQIGGVIGGVIFVEVVFAYPGLGLELLRAISENDYPLLSGLTLIITIMVLISVFLLDILYGFIDPRVKASLVD